MAAGSLTICLADDPKPDPACIATGDKTTAVDAGGNSFVVAEPTDKNDPDYVTKKKAFDEYQSQAAREPLALKLADSVGHVRVATNFAWTLNTGYLVLFMQAGFALLTCGLVRKKNAAHLMMLNFAAYVFAFLAYYAVGYAFQFGAVAVNAAPTNLGGVPTLNHFLIGGGSWGFLGGKGFFLTGPAYDAGSNVLTLFEVVFMETAGYIIVGAICERIIIGVIAGVIVCLGVLFFERVAKVDDPCGAISVHGLCGWFGAVSVGIFADGTYGSGWNGVGATSYLGHAGQGVTGLLHGGTRQFLVQLGGATLCAVWAFGATFAVFTVVNKIRSMRVTPEVEEEGLDVPEFGMSAYPEDTAVGAEA